MDKTKQYYNYINIGINNDSPVYILVPQLKDAIEINPVHFQTPIDAVTADTHLPAKNSDEIYIVVFENEARDLTVSKNVKPVKDHRGLTVWHKDSGYPTEWSQLTLEGDYTDIKPPFDYAKWLGDGWVEDSEKKEAFLSRAAEAEFNQNMAMANVAILPLQDAVDLDIATASEIEALSTWKKYRVLLSRVKTQADWPLIIDWPIYPELSGKPALPQQ